MEKQGKKGLKWLWVLIGLLVVGGIVAWCVIASSWGKDVVGSVDKQYGIANVWSINAFLAGIFIVTTLGYLLGRITIKGVSLGTAGVFLVAILYGYL